MEVVKLASFLGLAGVSLYMLKRRTRAGTGKREPGELSETETKVLQGAAFNLATAFTGMLTSAAIYIGDK